MAESLPLLLGCIYNHQNIKIMENLNWVNLTMVFEAVSEEEQLEVKGGLDPLVFDLVLG